MHRKSFYSRRVTERRKRRLKRLEKLANYSTCSSDDEQNKYFEETHHSTTAISNIFPVLTDDFANCNDYHADEHDNTEHPNENTQDSSDQSPALFLGSKLSVMKAMKLLMTFLTSDVNLDKRNVLRLLKLIRSLLPQPNVLPVTWKSIIKLFGCTNMCTTIFLCSSCHTKCGKSTFNTKICRNATCSRSNAMLKPHEIVELVNLDIRTQLKSIITRNLNLILKNDDYFPTADVTNGSFYRATASESECNTITLILHTDGAPLIRTTKQSIWPLFASVVEIPPPVREYQKNIVLIGLWSSKSKPDVNIFLKHAVNEIKHLMFDGTSIFIDDQEFRFVIRTQFFISDLPARSLFLQTTCFNGYYACHYCLSKGVWSGVKVLYPYAHNDFQLRTHDEFIAAAKEAEEKSTKKRNKSVSGIKGVSCLSEIMSFPQQILVDYMHLVCINHVQTLISRWIGIIGKDNILSIDSMLSGIRIPHNIHVVYKESIAMADNWKAKHRRLFVLNIGLPIAAANLPRLYASHWAIYSLAIKLLHAPESSDDIDFAEYLLHFYCRTIAEVYDQSLEYYSLHAHLHLPAQVRLHGGLAFSSAFTFESCIHYIKKKVHGTKQLASQIAYWYQMENMVNNVRCEIPSCHGINQIDLNSQSLVDYREMIVDRIQMNNQHLKEILFYKRYKHDFVTYHTTLYDKPFRCCSYIISYNENGFVCYGSVIIFYKYQDHYFAIIQKYDRSTKKISDFLELPEKMVEKVNELYPLVELSNHYEIISVDNFRHKCISVRFHDIFCLSEVRVDFEHD